MGKILTIRVETESHSIYQMRQDVSASVTTLMRVPGPDARVLTDEYLRVVSYQPIVKGNPFVVTVDEYGENRTIVSTPVKTVQTWLV